MQTYLCLQLGRYLVVSEEIIKLFCEGFYFLCQVKVLLLERGKNGLEDENFWKMKRSRKQNGRTFPSQVFNDCLRWLLIRYTLISN